jgi:hypothetical protein
MCLNATNTANGLYLLVISFLMLIVPLPVPVKAVSIRHRRRRLYVSATQNLLDSHFDPEYIVSLRQLSLGNI